MAKNKIKIETEHEYDAAMLEIDFLMKKGDGNLTPEETERLRNMAVVAEAYEDKYYPLPMPSTIGQMVGLKMYEMKLTQTALAEMLGLARPKLSQILNGKREPDVSFLKAVYQKLKIDPGFLLDKA